MLHICFLFNQKLLCGIFRTLDWCVATTYINFMNLLILICNYNLGQQKILLPIVQTTAADKKPKNRIENLFWNICNLIDEIRCPNSTHRIDDCPSLFRQTDDVMSPTATKICKSDENANEWNCIERGGRNNRWIKLSDCTSISIHTTGQDNGIGQFLLMKMMRINCLIRHNGHLNWEKKKLSIQFILLFTWKTNLNFHNKSPLIWKHFKSVFDWKKCWVNAFFAFQCTTDSWFFRFNCASERMLMLTLFSWIKLNKTFDLSFILMKLRLKF